MLVWLHDFLGSDRWQCDWLGEDQIRSNFFIFVNLIIYWLLSDRIQPLEAAASVSRLQWRQQISGWWIIDFLTFSKSFQGSLGSHVGNVRLLFWATKTPTWSEWIQRESCQWSLWHKAACLESPVRSAQSLGLKRVRLQPRQRSRISTRALEWVQQHVGWCVLGFAVINFWGTRWDTCHAAALRCYIPLLNKSLW